MHQAQNAQHNGNGHASNCRGIIVVDSGALMSLAGATSVKNGKLNMHYFDMLTFLSQNGYRIIIPEIVCMEVGSVLAGGKCLNDYFTFEGKLNPRFSPDPSLHEAERRFLISAATCPIDTNGDANAPGLYVLPTTTGAGVIKKYCQWAHEIVEEYGVANDTARGKIRKLQEDYVPIKRNFGERIITNIISKLPKKPPVFVLSEDWEFLEPIAKQRPSINVTTVQGLLLALANSGLRKAVSCLPKHQEVKEMFDHCREAALCAHPDHTMSHKTVDCSAKALGKGKQDFPLKNSFRQLADSLNIPEVKSPYFPPSRSKAKAQKEAKENRLRGGLD